MLPYCYIAVCEVWENCITGHMWVTTLLSYRISLMLMYVCCAWHVFKCLNTYFVGNTNTINRFLNFIDIYSFTPVSGCLGMGPCSLLWPGWVTICYRSIKMTIWRLWKNKHLKYKCFAKYEQSKKVITSIHCISLNIHDMGSLACDSQLSLLRFLTRDLSVNGSKWEMWL